MKLFDLIQLTAAIAVLAGIGLVVWELQQTKALTNLLIVHGNMDELAEDRRGIYGEELHKTLAAACTEPGSLSLEQAFVLEAYFENQAVRVVRYALQVDIAGFSTNWKARSRVHLHKILSFPHGRTWIQNHRILKGGKSFSHIVGFVTEVMEDDIEPCTTSVSGLLEDIGDI